MRCDGRANDSLRRVEIIPNYIIHPLGSCLISMGETKVICTASFEERVPQFLLNSGQGWLSAEYSLLPGSTPQRSPRESSRTKIDGRTQEIQRLIGRSLRSMIDLKLIGERTIWIDCDVIQADGGTRACSVTGGFVALCLALKKRYPNYNKIIRGFVAAISVGLLNSEPILDLNFEEDFACDVDLNTVMTDRGEFIEVQGTAEKQSFSIDELNLLLNLAKKGTLELINIQKTTLGIN